MDHLELEAYVDMASYEGIFIETRKDLVLRMSAYQHLPEIIKSFLLKLEEFITLLKKSPSNIEILSLQNEITWFKKAIQIDEHQIDPIDSRMMKSTRKKLLKMKNDMDPVLKLLSQLRKEIAFGGNFVRAILRRPKIYSRDIDSSLYEITNRNIRIINLAINWAEKALIDTFHMIDQDINILMIVDTQYIKTKIYESPEEMDNWDDLSWVENYVENLENENDLMTEGINMITLYHSSPFRLNVIRPTAPDLGNAFQKPGWSCFCWKNIEKARAWAILKVLKENRRALRIAAKVTFKPGADWNIKTYKPMVIKEELDKLRPFLNNLKTYIYTIRVPISKVGLGNDSTHDEYTIRESVVPVSVEVITLNKNTIDRYVQVVDSPKNINAHRDLYLQGKFIGDRGALSYLMTNDYSYNYLLIKECKKAIDEGRLKIGDNLEKYFLNNNMNIRKIYTPERFKNNISKLISDLFNNDIHAIKENSNRLSDIDPIDQVYEFEFTSNFYNTGDIQENLINEKEIILGIQENDDDFDELFQENIESFEERSKGVLKFSFRHAYNIKDGHLLKIIFDLNPNDVTIFGNHISPGLSGLENKFPDKKDWIKNREKEIIRNIPKTGHNNFASKGIVKAIIDMDTKKRLNEVTAVGFVGGTGTELKGTQFYVPDEFNDSGMLSNVWISCPMEKRERIAKSIGHTLKGITYRVGEKETIATYKMTSGSMNVGNVGNVDGFQNGIDIGHYDNIRDARNWELKIKDENRQKRIDELKEKLKEAPEYKHDQIIQDFVNTATTKEEKVNATKDVTATQALMDVASGRKNSPTFQRFITWLRTKFGKLGIWLADRLQKLYDTFFKRFSKGEFLEGYEGNAFLIEEVDLEFFIINEEVANTIEEGVDLMSDDEFNWIQEHLMKESKYDEDDKPKWPNTDKSGGKKTSKNGSNRKRLYVMFIEWAKEQNPKNSFGNLFDRPGIFEGENSFVPHDLRYFYMLVNPILCILEGNLVFFSIEELQKLNISNKKMNEELIFAATEEDVRVYKTSDRKIYLGKEENGVLKLERVLANSFDLYLQQLINKGNILSGSN